MYIALGDLGADIVIEQEYIADLAFLLGFPLGEFGLHEAVIELELDLFAGDHGAMGSFGTGGRRSKWGPVGHLSPLWHSGKTKIIGAFWLR